MVQPRGIRVVGRVAVGVGVTVDGQQLAGQRVELGEAPGGGLVVAGALLVEARDVCRDLRLELRAQRPRVGWHSSQRSCAVCCGQAVDEGDLRRQPRRARPAPVRTSKWTAAAVA